MQCLKKILGVFINRNSRSFSLSVNYRSSPKLSEYFMKVALKSLSECCEEKNVPWTKVVEEIQNKIQNFVVDDDLYLEKIHSSVLLACISLKRTDLGVSFFRFLKRNMKEIPIYHYSSLLKLLKMQNEDVIENKDLVDELFTKLKPLMSESELIFQDGVGLFSKFPHLHNKVFSMSTSFESQVNLVSVLGNFFDKDNEKFAWEILKERPSLLSSSCIDSFLNYCIREAEKEQFSIEKFNKLITFCEKHTFVVPSKLFIYRLKDLCKVLNNQKKTKLKWSVCYAKIKSDCICTVCKQKLKPVYLSDEDVLKLRNELEKNCFVNIKNHLKIEAGELKNFIKFLDSSSYKYVVDGMNIFFKYLSYTFQEFDEAFSKALGNDFKKTIFISRHSYKTKGIFNHLRKSYRFYYPNSLSDDDLLIIYGCLYGGPDTYFISGDYFRGYVQYFYSFELQRLFMKWLITRKYQVKKNIIVPPEAHGILPQLTTEGNDGFIWHIPINFSVDPKFQADVSWICFRALPV